MIPRIATYRAVTPSGAAPSRHDDREHLLEKLSASEHAIILRADPDWRLPNTLDMSGARHAAALALAVAHYAKPAVADPRASDRDAADALYAQNAARSDALLAEYRERERAASQRRRDRRRAGDAAA